MSYGTAPRKINGVWVTAKGKRLTSAQSRIWDKYVAQGRFDETGHRVSRADVAVQFAAQPKTPTVKAGQKESAYKTASPATQKLHGQAKKEAEQQTNALVSRQFGGVEQIAAKANKVVNPVAGGIITALSPYTAAKDTVRDVRHGNLGSAAVDATGILTVGPGKVRGALKGLKAGLEAERAARGVQIGGEAGKKLFKALPEARKETIAQRKVYRAEKAPRFQAIDSTYEKAGGGIKGSREARAELAGAYTKVEGGALKHLSEDDFNLLHDAVYKHPHLSSSDKVNAWDALERGMNHEPLQNNQLDLLEKVFAPPGKGSSKAHMAAVHSLRVLGQVVNIPRTVMSTLDASFGLRQALPLAVSHPALWGKAYGKSFKYFGFKGGEARYHAGQRAIEDHPLFEEAKKAGVPFTDITKKMKNREEAYPSSLAETLTGGKNYSPIRMSSRAYTGMANEARMEYYAYLKNKALKKGYDDTKKLREGIASLVGVHTGRGGLGKFEKAGPALNTVFFSPRLFMSRLQTVSKMAHAHPFVRHEAQQTLGKLIATVGGVTAAGTVGAQKLGLPHATTSADPRNADFMKLKIGNMRIDTGGGFLQPVRLAAEEAPSKIGGGKIISSTTGKTLRLGKGDLNRWDIARRFGEGKASPPVSMLMDFARGRTFTGAKTSIGGELISHGTPLGAQDAWDVASDKHSPWKGLGAFALSGLGVGVQDYKNKNLSRKGRHHSYKQPRDSHGRFARAPGRSFAGSGPINPEDHPAAPTHHNGRAFARGGG